MTDKPYPWTCGNCANKSVFPKNIEKYSTKFKYEGVLHELCVANFPMPTCTICSSQWISTGGDNLVTNALRQKVGILFPKTIKEQRQKLNLSEKQLADICGSDESAISRIENGILIQSTKIDKLLREALQL